MAKKTAKPRAQRSTKSSRSTAVQSQVEWSSNKQELQSQVGRELNRLNQEGTTKDFRKYANRLVEASGLFTKAETQRFVKAPDRMVTFTLCSLGVLHSNANLPLTEWVQGHIRRLVTHTLDLATTDDAEPVAIKTAEQVAAKPTIQDRLAEKTNELIGELEGEYDLVIQGRNPTYRPFDFLKGKEVVATQLNKYVQVFTERKQELELAQDYQQHFKGNKTWSDEVENDLELAEQLQLAEAYRHYTAKDYKRIFAWIDDLLGAVEQYRNLKRATKSARRVSPQVQAKRNAAKATKVKYLKADSTYSLASVTPLQVIGAQELWVFNVKTRKLGRYVAQDYQTLDFSGTSVKNFNPAKSFAKTLRKPQEQLRDFNKAGKVALRRFLEDIRATETKLSGRINEDTILLKVQ